METRKYLWLIWLIALLFAKPNLGVSGISFVEKYVDSNSGSMFSVDVGDMDGDGDLDVLAGGQTGHLYLYVNDGAGHFTRRTVEHDYGAIWSVEAFDLNRDGRMDIIGAVSREEKVVWWRNNGALSFSRIIIDDNMVSAEDIAAGDLDGDGDNDVVGFGWNDTTPCRWYENDGHEHFSMHELDYSYSWAHFVALADVDNDGDLDIVGSQGDGIAWWRNGGNGSFSRRTVIGWFSGAYCAQPADLDKDGKIDIMGAAHNIDTISWFRNSGGGSFTQHVLTNNFDDTHDAYVGDLDLDGDMDFVGASRGINGVAWFENDGHQSFTKHVISTNVPEAQTVVLGDLDGDGDLDIVSEARTGTKVYWWENTGSVSEWISVPDMPEGPDNGIVGESISFSTGGAHSNLGHTVEYQFDWGDGDYSGWGSSSASHSYNSSGTFAVKARARCATHTSKISSWSSAHSVTIVQETVSTPDNPTGNENGLVAETLTFTSSGAVSNAGHSVEYQFDWGDGNTSGWGSSTQTHAFDSVGNYNIRARARCQTHTSIVSSWSNALSVTINPRTFNVAGKFIYYSNSQPIPQAKIQVSGDVNNNYYSDEGGLYSFSIEENSNFTMTPSKNKNEDIGHLTISMYDAALAAQAALSLMNLTDLQKIAADADQNGLIYTYDAALIAQFAVGLDSPPSSHVGEWYFSPNSITIANIQSDKVDQNFESIVIGDVDGNWAATKLGKGNEIASNEAYSIEFSGDENLQAVSIILNQNTDMLSCDLDVGFNSDNFEFSSFEPSKKLNGFYTYFNQEKSRLRIGMFNSSPDNISGEIVKIYFKKKTEKNIDEIELNRLQINNLLLAEKENITNESRQENRSYILNQNYPNPFNSSTKISYYLSADVSIKLIVYNVFGQKVKTLANGFEKRGNHQITWDGFDDSGHKVSGGVYFYQLDAGFFKFTRKMIIIE